jgi:hypothetical protein
MLLPTVVLNKVLVYVQSSLWDRTNVVAILPLELVVVDQETVVTLRE